MPLTLEKIEALSPDQSSIDAARKLLKPGGWPKLAWDGSELVWGECQGSGATPYRVVISESDAGYKCSCPSRKFPCKHSLALMWLRAESKATFALAEVPEWVRDWVSRRRGPAAAVTTEAKDAKPKISMANSEAGAGETESDPKAEARAAAARERNRRERETAILAGLDELDTWLSDHVERGVAALVTQNGQACKLIAQRLVDAKASGLAARLEGLTAKLFALPEGLRPVVAIEELGQIYLLAEAYRRQDSLSAELKADVRQAVGWAITRETLLADTTALRVRGSWRVVATLSEVQADRLRRIETWLWNEDLLTSPHFALLLDFVPVATGAAMGGYSVGDRLQAELVFYPSSVPLRALILTSAGAANGLDTELQLPDGRLDDAYATYEMALRELPWIGTWPLSFRAARVRRSGKSLFLCDAGAAAGSTGFPLRPSQWETAAPLARLERLDGIGLWDGRYFTLCWAQTDLGRWVTA
jgi:hypothetical protein